jgi:hypothetical protein
MRLFSNHHMYLEITIDIQEFISTIEKKKVELEILNQIKSDGIQSHKNIIALQRRGFILNLS